MARKLRKKGSLDDLVYIIVILIFFGMGLLIIGKWTDAFNTAIQSNDDIPVAGKTAVGQMNNLYGGVLDNGFLFLTVGLCLVALIFAMMVIIHPVFFVLYFIMLAVVVFVSGAVSNIYQTAAAEPTLAPIAAKLIWTSHILTYLPFIIGVIGFILAIVMYKNYQQR